MLHSTQMYIPLKPLFSRHKGVGVQFTDEPTGALDSKTGREVLDFLKKLNREGNTIVMITHDSSIALEAERVVRIIDGRINFDGDVKEYAAII